MGFDAIAFDGISKKKFKYMTITATPASGKIIAPADVLFISGSGGGGGGDANIGGASGAACDFMPYYTTKGSEITVTIAAGGAASADGGTTVFGSISLPGGQAGGSGEVNLGGGKSVETSSIGSGSRMSNTGSETRGFFITGANTYYASASYYGSGNSRFPSGGAAQGAGGYFGAGGNGVAAAANTGAGGGINSAGGSGILIIAWLGEA